MFKAFSLGVNCIIDLDAVDYKVVPVFFYNPRIECFHSRGQHLCKLLEQKKAFALEKSSTPTGLVWDTNMAAVSLFWDTNMAAVTSCENTL